MSQLQNIHAEIKLIIFIALSSYLTTPVNFVIGIHIEWI